MLLLKLEENKSFLLHSSATFYASFEVCVWDYRLYEIDPTAASLCFQRHPRTDGELWQVSQKKDSW